MNDESKPENHNADTKSADHVQGSRQPCQLQFLLRQGADRDIAAFFQRLCCLAELSDLSVQRSVLADWQKAEIAALTMQVQALNGLLTEAGEETEAVEGRRDAALQALSEKNPNSLGWRPPSTNARCWRIRRKARSRP